MSSTDHGFLTFADVPSARQRGRPGSQRRAQRRAQPETVPTLGRRSALKLATGFGAAIGLSAMNWFSMTRAAHAHGPDNHEGYQIWTNFNDGPCHPTLGYARNHNCDPVCGPSLPSRNFCQNANTHFIQCCSNYSPWHRNGNYGSEGVFWLRPNECGDNDEPNDNAKDGWLWVCNGIARKCHDGWKDIGNGPVRTICRT
jgi:hypothetical protein